MVTYQTGVTRILQGSGVSVTPSSGLGTVTVSANNPTAGVSSYNGNTGAVTGISSLNSLTNSALTITSPDGTINVSTASFSIQLISNTVRSLNSLVGALNITSPDSSIAIATSGTSVQLTNSGISGITIQGGSTLTGILNLQHGTGIGIAFLGGTPNSAVFTNTGVTALTASNGLAVSASTGAVALSLSPAPIVYTTLANAGSPQTTNMWYIQQGKQVTFTFYCNSFVAAASLTPAQFGTTTSMPIPENYLGTNNTAQERVLGYLDIVDFTASRRIRCLVQTSDGGLGTMLLTFRWDPASAGITGYSNVQTAGNSYEMDQYYTFTYDSI